MLAHFELYVANPKNFEKHRWANKIQILNLSSRVNEQSSISKIQYSELIKQTKSIRSWCYPKGIHAL